MSISALIEPLFTCVWPARFVDSAILGRYNSKIGRSGGMADALRSERSTRKGVRVQISPSAPSACSSVG